MGLITVSITLHEDLVAALTALRSWHQTDRFKQHIEEIEVRLESLRQSLEMGDIESAKAALAETSASAIERIAARFATFDIAAAEAAIGHGEYMQRDEKPLVVEPPSEETPTEDDEPDPIPPMDEVVHLGKSTSKPGGKNK